MVLTRTQILRIQIQNEKTKPPQQNQTTSCNLTAHLQTLLIECSLEIQKFIRVFRSNARTHVPGITVSTTIEGMATRVTHRRVHRVRGRGRGRSGGRPPFRRVDRPLMKETENAQEPRTRNKPATNQPTKAKDDEITSEESTLGTLSAAAASFTPTGCVPHTTAPFPRPIQSH